MPTIDFHVPWKVHPKQAMRIARMANGRPRTYQPSLVVTNARTLATFMAPHRPRQPLSGPLRATYVLTYPWLAGESQRSRKDGSRPKGTKPDCDNLGKQISDTLERCGFFGNDAQIADLRVIKLWGDNVGVQITIEHLTPESKR